MAVAGSYRWQRSAHYLASGLFVAHVLDLAAACSGEVQPLLWRATLPGPEPWVAYLIGSYPLAAKVVSPLPALVERALLCADVALFRLACSRRPGGGLGHFLDHCSSYPLSEAQDSIASRLESEQLVALRSAAEQLLESAPSECLDSSLLEDAARATRALKSPDGSTTLRAFYKKVTAAMNPSACLAEKEGRDYEDHLRDTFGERKPTFGLMDIEEECLLTQEASLDEEVKLARQMAADFGSASWLRNMTQTQGAVVEAVKCGDLGALSLLMERENDGGRISSLEELPWSVRTKLNRPLADGILLARERNPDRVAAVVLDVLHLVDNSVSGVKSVLTLLREHGFVVEQIVEGSELVCAPSNYSSPTPKQEESCLMPPSVLQPRSCNDFAKTWEAKMAADPLIGRVKKESNCNKCRVAEEHCDCEFTWENVSEFTKLCENTFVDGTYGRVMLLDFTRNPGSLRQGAFQAEKEVRGLHQNCYAASCKVDVLRLMEQRRWHLNDSSLAEGLVRFRCPSGADDCMTDGQTAAIVRVLHDASMHRAGAFGRAEDRRWAWAFASFVGACCLAALLAWFALTRTSKRQGLCDEAESGGESDGAQEPEVDESGGCDGHSYAWRSADGSASYSASTWTPAKSDMHSAYQSLSPADPSASRATDRLANCEVGTAGSLRAGALGTTGLLMDPREMAKYLPSNYSH